jgi:hypothetical protein
MTVLKIILLVLLGGILLLAIGVALLIWLAKRFFRRAMAADQIIPCRATLEPEPNPQWRSAAAVNGFINELRAIGFQDIGSFQLPELGGLLIHALWHPQEPAYAVVYDHKRMEPTMDVLCRFTDDTSVTATNTNMGRSLDTRPGAKTHWLGKASARHLFDAVRNHPHTAPPCAHTPEEFVARFQRAYAESMDWRLKKGGVSRDEIRRQAEQDGHSLTDEQFNEAYEMQREQYRRQLQEGCIAQFLDKSKMPAVEWEKIHSRAVVIPETFELKEIIEILDGATCLLSLDTEQRHQLEKLPLHFGENGIDIARKLLAENVAGLGLVKVGEVTEPVPAWILLVPDSEHPHPLPPVKAA